MNYIKLFETTSAYDAYTADTTNFIKPNLSLCKDAPNEIYFNPLIICDETSVYEIIGTPSYPNSIEGDVTSFEISFNYIRTDTDSACTETITEGSDSVTVECGANPSTSTTRTINGTVTWNGNEIEYTLTQNKKETRVVAKFNVTDTSNPTKILSATTGFSSIEVDGVEQQSVTTGYTFDIVGEHIVKYTLKSPTSIGTDAFRYCPNLTNITIPDTVTTIGSSAFTYCYGLTSVTIGNGVTSIGNYVFRKCSGLTSIDIPDSVTSIGNSAFYECISLTSIIIPDSVTSIGSSAFYDCFVTISNFINNSSLDEVANNYWECKIVDSIIDGLCIKDNSIIKYKGNASSVAIPDSVTSISSKAFYCCSGLTSVTIGSGVTSIGSYAFQYCSGLTSVTIGNGVTSIGNYAFKECSGLTSVTSNAITAPTIQTYTFYNVKTSGTLYVPIGSSGYDTWLGKLSGWTKVEQ